MTSSDGNIFRGTGPLCGEFTGPGEFPTQRPVTRSFDVFFDLRPNKRLSKQWPGWWFETLSRSFWRHRNVALLQYRRMRVSASLFRFRQMSLTVESNLLQQNALERVAYMYYALLEVSLLLI